MIADYRERAHEEFGRELQIWSHAYIVQGETEQDAKDFFHEYVHRQGRLGGGNQSGRDHGAEHRRPTPEMLRAMKMHFIGGWGGFALIGTKEQVVDGLAGLSALGLDGVVVSLAALHRRHADVPARDLCRCSGRPGCGKCDQVTPIRWDAFGTIETLSHVLAEEPRQFADVLVAPALRHRGRQRSEHARRQRHASAAERRRSRPPT